MGDGDRFGAILSGRESFVAAIGRVCLFLCVVDCVVARVERGVG